MSYDEREQQRLQESLLTNHQKEYTYDDYVIPKTTNIGWLKSYFRGHFLPSIKRKFLVIIFFIIFLIVLLSSQGHSNDDNDESTNKSNITSLIEQHNDDDKYFPSISKNEKFLTYLPHGNIFQQKEELKNAIYLSYTLDRTLIIPPIILGLNLELTNSRSLQRKLISLRSNKHQSECFIKTTIPEQKETKYEIDINCLNGFDSYSLLSWEELFNLDLVKKKIHILHGNDFDQIRLEKMLNITNSKRDVYEITKSYLKKIQLTSIRSRNEKLFIFDYLSGKDLIDLNDKNLLFLNQLSSSLRLNNPIILDVSKKIIDKLGGKGNYVGVHARLYSISHSKKFIRESLSNLTLSLKNYSKNLCLKEIIYFATDLNKNDPILSSFLSKFPCVMMLNDFNEILLPLFELYNSRDGSFLFKFFEPFVNSIVASNGGELFTIDDGIYSEYAKKLHNINNVDNELSL